MANSVLLKALGLVNPAISFASVANGAGRICAQVDNSTTRATRARIGVQIKTGAVAPTLNSLFRIYCIRNTTNMEGGQNGSGALGAVDAAVATEPVNAECIGTIQIDASTAKTYKEVFLIQDPGPKFSIVYWNASGQAVDSTNANHSLDVELDADELQ